LPLPSRAFSSIAELVSIGAVVERVAATVRVQQRRKTLAA
jgi:hypothetical protein